MFKLYRQWTDGYFIWGTHNFAVPVPLVICRGDVVFMHSLAFLVGSLRILRPPGALLLQPMRTTSNTATKTTTVYYITAANTDVICLLVWPLLFFALFLCSLLMSIGSCSMLCSAGWLGRQDLKPDHESLESEIDASTTQMSV